MTAFYSENEPATAAWLRELAKAGLIAAGQIDERDILDVVPAELAGFRQCHFFAGVGGWSYALRLAGWPDDRSVWTGSCPCQPFSSAGKGEGFADERHLWPAFYHLISQCRPVVLFGEQVASPDGRAWLDLVQSDLEAIGYTVGSLVAPAAGFGAPHARHRIYWVADRLAVGDGEPGKQRRSLDRGRNPRGDADQRPRSRGGVRPGGNPDPAINRRPEHVGRSRPGQESDASDGIAAGGHSNANIDGRGKRRGCQSATRNDGPGGDDAAGALPDPGRDKARRNARVPGEIPEASPVAQKRRTEAAGQSPGCCLAGVALGDASRPGPQERPEPEEFGGPLRIEGSALGAADPLRGFWRGADWIWHRDGKYRAVRPGAFPLAHGVPARMVRLRGYGNAIVPQQAAAFIRAYREVRGI